MATECSIAAPSYAQVVWQGFAKNPQHTAISGIQSQPLDSIVWQTPVDLQPQFSGNDLLIHYGSPVITSANTVIVPVKTGATGGFELQARSGGDGTLRWTQTTDYTLPPHNWIPSYSPTLTPQGRLYWAGAGGTAYYRGNLDSLGAVIPKQVAFYGGAIYAAHKANFDRTVQINTPLTSDTNGTIYFGFEVNGATPLNLKSGLARVDKNGNGTFVTIGSATQQKALKVVMNCAPALSNDGKTVYIATNSGGSGAGYLLALESATLAVKSMVMPHDPSNGMPAKLPDNGTASPTIGADGRVFFGVLDNPVSTGKGWLRQFNADLSRGAGMKPGAFGWDDTASIVPSTIVPSYKGLSTYLLMTKYNNYAGIGHGDGKNRIAILDPNGTQIDSRTGVIVMKEVLTILGVTPDKDFPNRPGAVREWCVNSAVVDPLSHSILANSEDGKLYRWDLTTNTFTQVITLTSGVGEAYTPTLIGADGKVYAINDATLFAVGARQ